MKVKDNDNLKLCAGTFFFLLLKANENSKSSQDLRFKYFLRVIDPQAADAVEDGMVADKFHTYASKLRNCYSLPKGKYIRFGDQNICTYFKDEVKENKTAGIDRVVDFCKEFVPDNARPWLVRSILELIESDEGINDNDMFYIKPGFVPSYKSEIFNKDVGIIDISFYDFLLGIWFYVYEHYTDNAVGRRTIEILTDSVKNNVESEFNKNVIGSEETYPNVRISYEIGTGHGNTSDANDLEKLKERVYIQDGDVCPDLRFFNPEEDIVYISAKDANVKDMGKFGKYMVAAYKKRSMRKTFVYDVMRPFREFYVCNDISKRVYGRLVMAGGGARNLNGSETPISNVQVNDFVNLSNLICGQGGLGKTMLMNHLFLSTIDNYFEDPCIPIFVSLADYIPRRRDLLYLIKEAVTRYDTTLQLSDIVELLKEGHNVILLDGLDEIPKGHLEKFIRELNIFADSYADNALIVSSRYMPETRLLEEFDFYDLCPLSEEQAFEMIRKLDPVYIDDSVKERFISNVKNKRFRFNEKEKEEFFGNPLFLTIMLIAYSQTNDIPTQRYLLYEQAYQAMATRHDALKGITRNFFTGLNERDFKRVFGHFCADSYVGYHHLTFTEELLRKYMEQVIDDENLDTTYDMFYKDVFQKLCLMFVDGTEYKFIHRSFQEYFAAYYFTTLMDDEYADVYDYLIELDNQIVTDDTIPMLYGLDYRKCEKYIIIPFLESIVDAQDDKEPKEYDEEYKDFLRRFYSTIEYAIGELDDDDAHNDLESALYLFVTDNYKIRQRITGQDFDDEDGFSDCDVDYYLVQDFRFDPEGIYTVETDTSRYLQDNGKPYDSVAIRSIGKVCTIDTTDVVTLSTTFNKVRWELFNLSSFPLRKEFDDIIKLLLELRKKYSTAAKKKRRFGLR